MERNGMNGSSAGLAQYETPFADIPTTREQAEHNISSEDFYSQYFKDAESPFSRTYEATAAANSVTPAGEEYVDLLAGLHDQEFQEALYDMANELEETWRNKVSDEIAMGNNFVPFVTQQATSYFEPVLRETGNIIDRVSQHFSGNNLADHNEASVERFFENFDFEAGEYSPAQEQFFKKIVSKVKSVVSKGVELAKKGVAVVGKIMPMGMILNKLKPLLKPLLDKVLKFAINKLPKNLQPHAQTLSNKFLKLEMEEEGVNEAEAESGLEAIQTELDHHIAQLVFSQGEEEADGTIINYEASGEALERENNYEASYAPTPSLDAARLQFINELKELQPGESPAPAIERFLPVVIQAVKPIIKMALNMIGRQKVIDFLAGLLAKLVGKFIPPNIAQPLAARIIDVGMKMIGFETQEAGKTDLAFEAIAYTIEDTVRNMRNFNEANLNNTEDLTVQLLDSFEVAAANHFPAQYIKEPLRPTKQNAIWIGMPRNNPVKSYKKFTHVYDVNIEPHVASTLTTFRSLPLANFLRDKYGIDNSKPVKARVHVYELKKGNRLSVIAKSEKLPGLNGKQPRSWVQLLPLTKKAASMLLNEPGLGKDVSKNALSSRLKATPGQRYYYLEIEGTKLRIPPVHRVVRKNNINAQPVSNTESRSADIQAVINFVKSEIKLSYYFSEEDAKEIVEKLNKNDVIGASTSIRNSVKKVLNDILLKNVQTKVKIVHEAIPQLFLEDQEDREEGEDREENFASIAALGKSAGKNMMLNLVKKMVDKISARAYDAVVNFFKARAAEFKQAQAEPKDGVTIKLTWSNVGGMSTIRTVINAIQGKLSLGNLTDLALPSFTIPDIKIAADKKFD